MTKTSAAPPSKSSTRRKTNAPSSHLIEATKDKDWWVSERAVDALAEIGSKRAIPRLVEMLGSQTQGRSLPTVVRALGKLGDTKIIEPLFSVLQRPEKEVKLEAIQALAKLADERRADVVRNQIQAASIASGDQTIANAALRAVEEIDKRHSTGSSTHTPGVAASTSVGATARASPDPRRTAATLPHRPRRRRRRPRRPRRHCSWTTPKSLPSSSSTRPRPSSTSPP